MQQIYRTVIYLTLAVYLMNASCGTRKTLATTAKGTEVATTPVAVENTALSAAEPAQSSSQSSSQSFGTSSPIVGASSPTLILVRISVPFTPPGLSGDWVASNIPFTVSQSGYNFSFTYSGTNYSGYFLSANQLYIPSISMIGTLSSNGTIVYGSNGAVWTRPAPVPAPAPAPAPAAPVIVYPEGLFLVADWINQNGQLSDSVYYSNGSHFCGFASWDQFVNSTGRIDTNGIPRYAQVPSLYDGTCQ